MPRPTNSSLCAARQYVQLCTQRFCFRFAMLHFCILQGINFEVFTAADCIFMLTESILKMEAVHSFETSEHSTTSRCRTQDNTVTCPSISFCNDQNKLRLGQGAPIFDVQPRKLQQICSSCGVITRLPALRVLFCSPLQLSALPYCSGMCGGLAFLPTSVPNPFS